MNEAPEFDPKIEFYTERRGNMCMLQIHVTGGLNGDVSDVWTPLSVVKATLLQSGFALIPFITRTGYEPTTSCSTVER